MVPDYQHDDWQTAALVGQTKELSLTDGFI